MQRQRIMNESSPLSRKVAELTSREVEEDQFPMSGGEDSREYLDWLSSLDDQKIESLTNKLGTTLSQRSLRSGNRG